MAKPTWRVILVSGRALLAIAAALSGAIGALLNAQAAVTWLQGAPTWSYTALMVLGFLGLIEIIGRNLSGQVEVLEAQNLKMGKELQECKRSLSEDLSGGMLEIEFGKSTGLTQEGRYKRVHERFLDLAGKVDRGEYVPEREFVRIGGWLIDSSAQFFGSSGGAHAKNVEQVRAALEKVRQRLS